MADRAEYNSLSSHPQRRLYLDAVTEHGLDFVLPWYRLSMHAGTSLYR